MKEDICYEALFDEYDAERTNGSERFTAANQTG